MNTEDKILIQNNIQQLNKTIHNSIALVSHLGNLIFLTNIDLKQIKTSEIKNSDIDFEDDDQMHVFESLRKTIERQKERIRLAENYKEVLEDKLQQTQSSFNEENHQLKQKLHEVFDIQRGLKEKFDNNVSLLERLVSNESELKHAIIKSQEELQIVKENNDFLNNKLNEAESLTESLKKNIKAKAKEREEWENRLKKQIEEKDEEVRTMNKKLLDIEESLQEAHTEVKKSNYAKKELLKTLEEQQMK